MRSIISLLILGSLAAAQEKPPPKNEQLIALFKELRESKDPPETIQAFADAQKKLGKQLNDETIKVIADLKAPPGDAAIPRATVYAEYTEKFLKDKRLPEARASLDILQQLYQAEANRLDRSTQYFGLAFLAEDFSHMAEWRTSLDQPAQARTLYLQAIAGIKRRQHYDLANGNLKANEEAIKALRDKVKKIDEAEKK